MSKVFQCDRCKAIFESRMLHTGEPFIAYRGMIKEIDLCPTCHKMLIDFLNNETEDKCVTCKFYDNGDALFPCGGCVDKDMWERKESSEGQIE